MFCQDPVEMNTDDVFDDSMVDEIRCSKLRLAENLMAYLEKQELIRESEPMTCDSSLVENVTSNYVIAKKILSYLPWQDKLLCKNVCSMWYSAVHALEKEQQSPADFVIDLQICAIRGGIKFKKSNNFSIEPLAVLTFANMAGFTISSKCEVLVPSPCTPQCDKEHCLIDVVNVNVSAPKTCMLTVRASYLSYMPLPQSITYEHMVTNQMFVRATPFIGGVYIPAIPDVQFHVINIKTLEELQTSFYDRMDKLAQTQYVKGALVYVTDTYILHASGDSLSFLNYFRELQPDVPYAMGGCIVEDVMFEPRDIEQMVENVNNGSDFISENIISIGLFSVPKSKTNSNFEMYSLIIESNNWTKAKIQTSINEFSKKVPPFENSVVLKLSCVGRGKKHELEQDYFRAAFPHTRLVGCYGNGELGLNHPARPPSDDPPTSAKRYRGATETIASLRYSYSTVFVYIGWGKVLSENK
ncbi:hypothetical protein K1T71_006037 [Dendrolimus kikuchii]|uniref:Uncharacterized protein n=1 Tax=Dendrolimus kikuchii TaxID=765133 RepID=A0ACC1D2Q3_9NEOP|nr:hypothetical protein K1T71_006037 [Dendrolimus kikuchii]